MSLYARITATNGTKITVHRFGAALRQMAAGQLTRQQVIDAFLLTGTDVTEFDALIATYNALLTNNTANIIIKAQWPDRMEDVFLLCETGDYTEAKAKTALGF
jgi:hypothetical protein